MTDVPVLNGAIDALKRSRALIDRLDDLADLLDGLPIIARWDTLDVNFSGGAQVDIARLRVRTRSETEPFLDADVKFAFLHGKLQPGSTVRLREPVELTIGPPNLYVDDQVLAFRWQEGNINRWLRRAAADLQDEGTTAPSAVTLRLLYGGGARELRLDWAFGTERTFALPGLKVTTPDSGQLSLVLRASNGGAFDRLALVLTVGANKALTAQSTFAWGRGEDRELQNEPDKASDPLLTVTLTAQQATSVVLLDLALDQTASGQPRFFRQLAAVLPELDLASPEQLRRPTPLGTAGKLAGWSGTLTINTDGFDFPFLNSGQLQQGITIDGPPATIAFNPDQETINIPLGITVKTGPLLFKTSVDVIFNFGTFALDVQHSDGLKLLSEHPKLPLPADGPDPQHKGLTWQFAGAKDGDKYHYLTLATENYDYRIIQAPGATFTVSYGGISEEPLRFTVYDFAVGDTGISMRATVSEEPVRIKGLDTKFRFRNSGFEMVDNEIRAFTLGGSGALPPDLVGDATADIWLRFDDRGNGLELIEGAASLQGEKMLDCKPSRFRFSVDRIGLNFVREGQFHLYFTLTGSAEFVLQEGDNDQGALAWLPGVKINMVDCPLTGDMRVIARHVDFLITLPKPLSFSFLGCFEMEIRAFGFFPQAPMFGGDAAISITGQLRFAQGEGDNNTPDRDYHKLYIGLPEKGGIFPRIHFEQISVSLSVGELFRLEGMVRFYNNAVVDGITINGFGGQGMLDLPGLPVIRAAFSFVRVRRNSTAPWVRAWFIYLEVGKLSVGVKILPIFIREIGLGFGYRYTIASISAADKAKDLQALVKQLDELSRSQADLARLDAWAVDLEAPGEAVRWTIVIRAMLSNTTVSEGIVYNETGERELPNPYLFDAMLAFRSDFTFYISARAWINVNYNDYLRPDMNVRDRPLLTGYVLLSPRQKRFLARLVSNPDGSFGTRPALPTFVEEALRGSRFSAGLLIEPGLVHYELGWPNQCSWQAKIGPLTGRYSGGFIFRIDFRAKELVIGLSYEARATFSASGGVSVGFAGVNVRVFAEVAYGGRFIGVVGLNPETALQKSAFYGAIGLELQIEVEIEFWIKLLFFKKSGTISLGITLTASLELGINGISPQGIGARGTGTISLRLMGRGIRFTVKLGFGEENVEAVVERTQRYLTLGLEASEVAGVPGVPAPILTLRTAVAERAERLEAFEDGLVLGPNDQVASFETPHYVIFAIHRTVDGWSHFVLLPKGEPEDVTDPADLSDNGFLPAPPTDSTAIDHDFRLHIPGLETANYKLEQFIDLLTPAVPSDSSDEIAPNRSEPWVPRVQSALRWRANWQQPIITADGTATDGTANENLEAAAATSLTLAEYLSAAFVIDSLTNMPLRDPAPFRLNNVPLSDERVYNPSDAAFEAAVRGAYEQFAGSPFFKFDPTLAYDTTLRDAFQPTTSIYTQSGRLDEQNQADANANQSADQIRSLIVQDIVADLRAYVAAPETFDTARSLAFQMGLVFRYRSGAPPWLEDAGGDTPTLLQRVGPDSNAPHDDAPTRTVRPFNVGVTNFAGFPPSFQRIQQYSSASTIAIAWDLAWEHLPSDFGTPAQREPEHHLAHYQVRRRALDSNERDLVFTVKPAEVLHRSGEGAQNSTLVRLAPRFQVVDQFIGETDEDRATLPPTGRSYLYTITPIDVADNPGRPLTLVITRYPDTPPQVPVDGALVVRYGLRGSNLVAVDTPAEARPLAPEEVELRWTEAGDGASRPGVETYRLVFRREGTLPIGSYALDARTQGDRMKGMPISNARSLPSDVKIELTPSGPLNRRRATIELHTLRASGVLPEDTPGAWRPEAWQVFFQTISAGDVPSVLAPVQLILQIEGKTASGEVALTDEGVARREERQPSALEWPTRPMRFEPLPPEDVRARVAHAHVPMPDVGATFALSGNDPLGAIHYQLHPAELRFIRFRWNQGPSNDAAYPLDLHAGYQLVQLDADDVTNLTLNDATRLSSALHTLQEIQMAPASDLPLLPADTLATSRWEAWYPSAVRRGRNPKSPDDFSGRIGPKPWYSWRDTLLEWPFRPPTTAQNLVHPFLQALIDELERSYLVETQAVPLAQAKDLAAFMTATAPRGDLYGWGVLQQLGLSVTLIIRDNATREPLANAATRTAVRDALAALSADPNFAMHYARALHVELLFQPGRSIEDTVEDAQTDALLVAVQISLRPTLTQTHHYARWKLSATPSLPVDLLLRLLTPASLINLSDPATGQRELPFDGANPDNSVIVNIRLDSDGAARLLVRGTSLPEIMVVQPALPAGANGEWLPADLFTIVPNVRVIILPKLWLLGLDEQATHLGELAALYEGETSSRIRQLHLTPVETFAPTDEDSVEFDVPSALDAAFGGSVSSYADQWQRFFKEYLKPFTRVSTGTATPALQTKAQIAPLLGEFLSWSLRFFDHGGDVPAAEVGALAATAVGPWLATAYPRAGTPAYSTPDDGGRLTYNHLIADKWAHIFRYYIRPYGRYDRLWDVLRGSALLFERSEKPPIAPIVPNLAIGGLDVVLDREEAVAKPLILRSGRLDQLGAPDKPAPPGRMWEVIVARHPEQVLSERNQTVARRLDFRQLAFALQRRIHSDYIGWLTTLETTFQFSSPIAVVANQYPDGETTPLLPEYPVIPDHVDLERMATDDQDLLTLEAERRSVDLPVRMTNFQQGVLALQWEALPFYYEHRLLLVAQAAQQVSEVNSVVQRDFEYCAPIPEARTTAIRADLPPAAEQPGVVIIEDEVENDALAPPVVRARRVLIRLQRFWDSLPERAQERWPSENPGPHDANTLPRVLASLPDRDVVYQIVEMFSGNIEVQVEYFFDPATNTYARRQLGQRFVADGPRVLPPMQEQGDFVLDSTLFQFTEDSLTQRYVVDLVAQPTRQKLSFRNNVLRVAGVLTKADCDAIDRAWFTSEFTDELTPNQQQDQQTIQRLYASWFSIDRLSRAFSDNDVGQLLPEATPQEQTTKADLRRFVDFPLADNCELIWHAPLSDADRLALAALPGDDEFKAAIRRLVATLDAPNLLLPARAIAPLGLDQPIPNLPPDISQSLTDPTTLAVTGGGVLSIPRDGDSYAHLRWQGLLFDEQLAALAQAVALWSQIASFAAAFRALIATLDANTITIAISPTRPSQADLPDSIRDQLTLDAAVLGWSSPAPDNAQRVEIAALRGDALFLDAANALLQTFDVDLVSPLQLGEAEPTPTIDAPELQGRLTVSGAGVNRTLNWQGPAPTDAQRAALSALTADVALGMAITELLAKLDAPREVPLALVLPRPNPDQLNPLLREQLTIAPEQLTWRGRLRSQAQALAFATLDDVQIDQEFRTATQHILGELSQQTAEVPLHLMARPSADALADLKDRLLIGRTIVRYHGLMTPDEGRMLRDFVHATSAQSDVAAIMRLYAQSLERGMRGRLLRVRARRGTAPPSAMQPIGVPPLDEA